MADTLATIRTNVRSRLDESVARFWSDAELNTWINEGARDIARRAETLLTTASINTVNGTQSYTGPSDATRIYRVEWNRDGIGQVVVPLEYRDFNSMDGVWWSNQRNSTGNPYWYTMWGFTPNLNIVLYPTPDTSVTAGLKVYYYQLPAAAVTDGDVVQIPQGWSDLINDYAEFSALRKDGNPEWKDAKQLYEEKLGNLIEVSRRWTDQADSIQYGNTPLPRWIWDEGW